MQDGVINFFLVCRRHRSIPPIKIRIFFRLLHHRQSVPLRCSLYSFCFMTWQKTKKSNKYIITKSFIYISFTFFSKPQKLLRGTIIWVTSGQIFKNSVTVGGQSITSLRSKIMFFIQQVPMEHFLKGSEPNGVLPSRISIKAPATTYVQYRR